MSAASIWFKIAQVVLFSLKSHHTYLTGKSV